VTLPDLKEEGGVPGAKSDPEQEIFSRRSVCEMRKGKGNAGSAKKRNQLFGGNTSKREYGVLIV